MSPADPPGRARLMSSLAHDAEILGEEGSVGVEFQQEVAEDYAASNGDCRERPGGRGSVRAI